MVKIEIIIVNIKERIFFLYILTFPDPACQQFVKVLYKDILSS